MVVVKKQGRQQTGGSRKRRSSPEPVLEPKDEHHIKEEEIDGDDGVMGDGKKQKKMTIEELQVHLQKEMEEEDIVLEKATMIRQNLARMKMTAAPEPKRKKTHWDHVLQEMVWLAKEFQKERKWKLQSAKRFASTVQRSNMDLESRVFIREKEEEKAARKRAAWISKEVMGLWNKAHKVVAFKVKTEVDARKKEVLDKQMDVLLKQTQKYSTLLADRLRTGGESLPVEDIKQEEEEREGGNNGYLPARSGTHVFEDEDDEMEYRSGEDDDADDEATLEEEERLARQEFGDTLLQEQMDETKGLEADADLPLEELLAKYKGYKPLHEVPVTAPSTGELGILTKDIADDDADVDEYRSGEDDDADDEATLEEEEKAALAESGAALAQVHAEECAGLEADADLPLEELLAKYKGYKPMSSDVKQEGYDNDKENTGMSGALEAMAAAQPTGYTLATTQVKTPVPFLLKGQLREYQHIGLDWLVTLYHKHLNGILADEMGLGKTIQTIALLSWLASERGDWGPHLIVVPTSVMLNWEMEFKRWCPAFKLLTYYGTPKERAAKRQGWSKPNAFHVCITSYTLILQDARMFRRKKWKYLILDEAHMIKNWKSQRWQTLLNFNSKRRLLITGTPLQNDLMELWSLMHFLMPQVFASHAQFKDWFSNPLTGMVEGSAEYNNAIISRLHSVLRPFLLRRLKKDVEKQLPEKHEHVIKCRLSKRQRQLYEEYVSQTETKNILASGNFMGIMNCLMQLRKVCNHPDLFEGRPIISAFDMDPLRIHSPTLVSKDMIDTVRSDLQILNLGMARDMSSWEMGALDIIEPKDTFLEPQTTPEEDLGVLLGNPGMSILRSLGRTPSAKSLSVVSKFLQDLAQKRKEWRKERMQSLGDLSWSRAKYMPPIVGDSLCSVLKVFQGPRDVHIQTTAQMNVSSTLLDMVKLPETRSENMAEFLKNFVFVIPKARAKLAEIVTGVPENKSVADIIVQKKPLWDQYRESTALLHVQKVRKQLFFPDKRLLQYDCGKLQELAALLARLQSGSHRALIFTQMSKMLDILEAFLNIHGYTYVRLDGATKPEMRQTLMQRFNTNPKIFCFILSTRSGGVGMNLTGADTVIFYDSDWNPAMDAQAQDRCHRIGQTREVHIYRLISEHTIEENILRKSDQKRHLDFLAIQSGGFNTDMLYGASAASEQSMAPTGISGADKDAAWREAMKAVEDEGDAAAAAAAEKETAAEMEEFTREAPAPSALSEDDKSKEDGSEANGEKDQKSEPAEEEDEVMKEVERMAHTDNGAYDPMQALNDALRPIERYAVRFIENYSDKIDKEALTAQMEATYKVQNFDIDAMEEAEEEREADIDADEEANVVSDWDHHAATKTYEEQVKAAEEEERKRAEAEEAWLAQQILLGIPEVPAPKRGRVGRPRKTQVSEDASKQELHEVEEVTVAPKVHKILMYPWDIQEDLVLTAVVYILSVSGEKNEEFIWSTASGALAAGCAASDSTNVQILSRKGKLRTNEACRNRYLQLQNAYLAAIAMGENDIMASEGYLQKLIAPAIKNLDMNLKEAERARGHARTAVSTILKALDSRQDNKISNTLAIELHAIRTGTSRWSALLNKPEDVSLSLTIPVAAGILKVVKGRCGEQQFSKIEPRLSAVIQAAKIESGCLSMPSNG